MTASNRRSWRRTTVLWSEPASEDMVHLALRPERWESHLAE